MNNGEEKHMSPTQQKLVDIYHPTFRDGYQHGRNQYLQEQIILTDKQLVELLQCIYEESHKDEAEIRDEGVYYSVGRLVGQMSGGAIARQPHEDNTRELQEAFLAKVMQEYGVEGKALSDTIRQLWAMQDQLAIELDADTFEQILNRGVEKGNCL